MDNNEFVIRTKTPKQYFRGRLLKCDLPDSSWVVVCDSYAGGGRKISILEVIYFVSGSKKRLARRLKSFAKGQGYIFSFRKSDF